MDKVWQDVLSYVLTALAVGFFYFASRFALWMKVGHGRLKSLPDENNDAVTKFNRMSLFGKIVFVAGRCIYGTPKEAIK